MSTREEVLAAVRDALAPSGGPRVPGPGADHDATGGAPTRGGTASDGVAEARADAPAVDRGVLLDLFSERVADYRAEVTRCAAADLGTVVVAALAGARSVVVPAGSTSRCRSRSSTTP